ncbi:MAG: hypothetical protein PHR28_12970 [candidate division Zixibacteria bacterium]|jgi:hypothetical protein|nr:hypothetical protein [candidate division Zixibacteria bacterium]
MISTKDLYEFQNDEAYRHFAAGYALMYSSGRCDTHTEYLAMMDEAFVELGRARAIEPENPHIVFWIAWGKDTMHAHPDEIIPILEQILGLCKNPTYHNTDHIADLTTYALNEYRNQQKNVIDHD